MANRVQFRRGTAAEATSKNPLLADGELGFETDTRRFKIGDGATYWNDLEYGGLIGAPGISIEWQGSFSLPPASPELNWGYYDTVQLESYVWDGSSWNVIAKDGAIGDNYWQGSNRFISTAAPTSSDGVDGDFWFRYDA